MSTEDRSNGRSSWRLRQAVSWRIRLEHATFDEPLHERWEGWIDVPENRRAFSVVEDIWEEQGYPRIMRRPYNLSFEDEDSQRFARVKNLLLDATVSISLRPRRALWLSVSAAVFIGAFVFSSSVAPATTRLEVAVTPAHNQTATDKTVQNDSSFETTSQTEIDVKISYGQRIFNVARGKAVFRAVNDPQRPMIVTAGSINASAVGADFSVSNTDESVIVAVAAGKVQLSWAEPDARSKAGVAVTLVENQQLVLSKDNSQSKLVKVAAQSD